MTHWQPTPDQAQQYATDGYFILRNVLPRDMAIEIRGVIKNIILTPEPDVRTDADPMDPMGAGVEARAARFRKLSNFAPKNPLIWYNVYAGDSLLGIARHFLGDDLLLKFNSCFVKPARTGSATPWPVEQMASGVMVRPSRSTPGWRSTRRPEPTAVSSLSPAATVRRSCRTCFTPTAFTGNCRRNGCGRWCNVMGCIPN